MLWNRIRFPCGLSVVLLCLVFWQSAAAEPANAVSAPKFRILVSIRPLALLVQDLVGDLGQVDVLLPANMDPHNATLRFSDRKKIADSEMLIWLGPELERFLEKAAASLPSEQQIRLDQINHLDWLSGERIHEHTGHDHHSMGPDPHVWLNPQNARHIVTAVADVLGQRYPDQKSRLQIRKAELLQRLTTLDKQIGERLAPKKHSPFGVYHDAYRHFVHHYGLKQLAAVNQMPEESLSARQMIEFTKDMQGAACLLVERQGNSATRLAERLGITTVLADPLASNSALQSFEQFMWSVAQAFDECLSGNH